MTETQVFPLPDDIDDEWSRDAAGLSRRADEILAPAEGRTFTPTTSLRRALSDDLSESRQWARATAERGRDAIRDEPIKAAAYALGLGVVLGLLLRR